MILRYYIQLELFKTGSVIGNEWHKLILAWLRACLDLLRDVPQDSKSGGAGLERRSAAPSCESFGGTPQ